MWCDYKGQDKQSSKELMWINHCLRCEGAVLLRSTIVRVEIKHSDHEGHKHHYEDHHEFKYVFHSPAQRDLQRPNALIRR